MWVEICGIFYDFMMRCPCLVFLNHFYISLFICKHNLKFRKFNFLKIFSKIFKNLNLNEIIKILKFKKKKTLNLKNIKKKLI